MANTLVPEHARRAAEFFAGDHGLPVIRHHRQAGYGGSCPLWAMGGGTFLQRAVAVEWETPSAQGVNVPHWAYLVATSRQAPDTAPGGLSGSWFGGPDPYSAQGHGLPAMEEDADQGPFKAAVASGWPLGIVLVALALLVAACFVTDGGGY